MKQFLNYFLFFILLGSVAVNASFSLVPQDCEVEKSCSASCEEQSDCCNKIVFESEDNVLNIQRKHTTKLAFGLKTLPKTNQNPPLKNDLSGLYPNLDKNPHFYLTNYSIPLFKRIQNYRL